MRSKQTYTTRILSKQDSSTGKNSLISSLFIPQLKKNEKILGGRRSFLMIRRRKLLLLLTGLKNSRDQPLRNQFEMRKGKRFQPSIKRNLPSLKSLLIQELKKSLLMLNENSKIMRISCSSNPLPRNQDLDLRLKSLLKKTSFKRNVKTYCCSLIFTSCLKFTKTWISIMMESSKDQSTSWP